MKKFAIVLLLLICVFIAGCGDSKIINGVEYDTYGFVNKSEVRNPNIKYELVYGNVVWAVLLSETIVAPCYFAGFSLYEPIRELTDKEKEVREIIENNN